MKAYWQALEPRQQRLIGVLVVVMVLALGYVGLWEPMVHSRDSQREEVAYHQATLAWLNSIESELLALKAVGSTEQMPSDRSLLSLADQTARAAGLAGVLSRIEPVNSDQVNVWLDGASFETVMSWLSELSVTWGVRVAELNVNRAQGEGAVDVRVNLTIER